MKRLAQFLVKRKIIISASVVALYLFVLLPVTIVLFPDSNLWLGLLVVVVGFLQALKTLSDDLGEWLAKLEAAELASTRPGPVAIDRGEEHGVRP